MALNRPQRDTFTGWKLQQEGRVLPCSTPAGSLTYFSSLCVCTCGKAPRVLTGGYQHTLVHAWIHTCRIVSNEDALYVFVYQIFVPMEGARVSHVQAQGRTPRDGSHAFSCPLKASFKGALTVSLLPLVCSALASIVLTWHYCAGLCCAFSRKWTVFPSGLCGVQSEPIVPYTWSLQARSLYLGLHDCTTETHGSGHWKQASFTETCVCLFGGLFTWFTSQPGHR